MLALKIWPHTYNFKKEKILQALTRARFICSEIFDQYTNWLQEKSSTFLIVLNCPVAYHECPFSTWHKITVCVNYSDTSLHKLCQFTVSFNSLRGRSLRTMQAFLQVHEALIFCCLSNLHTAARIEKISLYRDNTLESQVKSLHYM